MKLSWAVLGASWSVWGPPWAVLGPSRILLGRLEAIWEAPGALLGCRRPEQARTLICFKEISRASVICASSGPLGGSSWDPLGRLGDPWAVLKTSRAVLGPFEASSGLSWATSGNLGKLLAFFGAVLEAFRGSESPWGFQKNPSAPGAKRGLWGGALKKWAAPGHEELFGPV